MPDNPLNAVNRGVYISDNLPFLQRLNDECVDLVCIDLPFTKNETSGRKNARSQDPLKPPLTDEERTTDLALLKRWGITTPEDATEKGIDWPETAHPRSSEFQLPGSNKSYFIQLFAQWTSIKKSKRFLKPEER